MGAGRLDGGGDAAAGGRIGDAFGGAAGVGGGGTAAGDEGGGTTAAGAGGGVATTTGGGGTASGGGGGKEGGGEGSCGGGVDAGGGRGGGAAGDEGGSAGVALGCVTGAGESSLGVVVAGDGVAVEGGEVALMVIGEGEGEDAIGAQASSRLLESTTLRAVTFTAELLPWWWNWRREPWPTPQFKGDSSLNPADSRSNQPIEIPPLPFLLPLGSLAVRKNVDEVKSHLEYRTRNFSLKSARTALVPRRPRADAAAKQRPQRKTQFQKNKRILGSPGPRLAEEAADAVGVPDPAVTR